MSEADKELSRYIELFLDWIRKDAFIIIICLIAILICAFSLYNIESYKHKCNSHWNYYFEKCGCLCLPLDSGEPKNFTQNFTIEFPFWDNGSRKYGS